MPPKYTLWIESNDMLATAENLAGAIGTAAHYAESLSTLVLILETKTGEGWAVTRARCQSPGAGADAGAL